MAALRAADLLCDEEAFSQPPRETEDGGGERPREHATSPSLSLTRPHVLAQTRALLDAYSHTHTLARARTRTRPPPSAPLLSLSLSLSLFSLFLSLSLDLSLSCAK